MFKFTIPPKAFFLGLLMGLGGLILGLAVGAWTMPAIISAFIRHDLSTISAVPRNYGIFPARPAWYTPGEHTLWNLGIVLGLLGAALGMAMTQRCWECIVIKKCKWMTFQEVQDFYKRDPGG